MTGTVASFDRGRGYGFITGEDGRTYLVHFLAVTGAAPIAAGSIVEFTPVETARGPQAADVSIAQT